MASLQQIQGDSKIGLVAIQQQIDWKNHANHGKVTEVSSHVSHKNLQLHTHVSDLYPITSF